MKEHFKEDLETDDEDCDEEVGDCLDLMLGCCRTRQGRILMMGWPSRSSCIISFVAY